MEETNVSTAPENFLYGSNGFRLIQLFIGLAVYLAAFITHWIMDYGRFTFIPTVIMLAAYLILCYNVVISGFRKLIHLRIWDPDVLCAIATIGCIFIGRFAAAASTMLIYLVLGIIRDFAEEHSRIALEDLETIGNMEVEVIRGRDTVPTPPQDVSVGEQILIPNGAVIPIDGVISFGEALLDHSLYLGDAVPRLYKTGDRVFAGLINNGNDIAVRTTTTFKNSYSSEMLRFLEDPEDKTSTVGRFTGGWGMIYGITVLVLGLLLGIIPSMIFDSWSVWMYRAFTFMMAACPFAFTFTAPMAVNRGLTALLFKGLAVGGGRALENASKLETVVFNLTGTLTRGKPEVEGIVPAEGYRSNQVLEYAANAEALSGHSIAGAILRAYGKAIDQELLSEFNTIPGKGVSVMLNGHELLAGNIDLMNYYGIPVWSGHEVGTKTFVAADGRYVGYIVTSDKVRDDSVKTVNRLKEYGIKKVVMLTGGTRGMASLAAEETGVDDFGSNLSPNDKAKAIGALMDTQSGTLAYVGVEARDTALLRKADLGITMDGLGSERALKRADAVIMTNQPARVIDLIIAGRGVARTIKWTIWLSVAAKAASLIVGGLGIAGPWFPVLLDFGVLVFGIIIADKGLQGRHLGKLKEVVIEEEPDSEELQTEEAVPEELEPEAAPEEELCAMDADIKEKTEKEEENPDAVQ